MKEDITYSTLKKFAEGKYSWKEYLKVKHWFEDIDHYDKVKQYLFDQWEQENLQQQPDEKSLRHIYEQIEYHILLEEREKAQKRKLWNAWSQAAAILFIPVLALTIWYFLDDQANQDVNEDWVKIHAPEGARIQFALPDGSTGWLNSGSSLKYQPGFSRTRRVELAGEGYFDVVSRKSVFTVSAGDVDINVLGTEFNVMAYPDENYAEVVLTEGEIEVEGTRQYFERVLTPNHKLTFFPGEEKYTVQQVDPKPYTAWTEGFLMLDNEKLEDAVARMERWYNVDIVIRDETLKNYRFKATFQDEPLEEVLRLLALTTPMDYEIQKRVARQDSVYSKKKVIIRQKN